MNEKFSSMSEEELKPYLGARKSRDMPMKLNVGKVRVLILLFFAACIYIGKICLFGDVVQLHTRGYYSFLIYR